MTKSFSGILAHLFKLSFTSDDRDAFFKSKGGKRGLQDNFKDNMQMKQLCEVQSTMTITIKTLVNK